MKARTPSIAHRSARGFTLVELMVALSGGLFLSMVVFALARDSNRFYQRETRLANATLSGLVGFDRLRADIARAGFLTTPNIRRDPRVCTRPTATWPALLQVLTSVRLEKPGSAASGALTRNGLEPMVLRLAGSYVSADEFPVRTVINNGTDNEIFLQVNTGPLTRLGYTLGAPDSGAETQQQAILESVFLPGRILRIIDRSGFQHYGVVGSVTTGNNPSIVLAGNPGLTFGASGDSACGLKGLESGATVNVVNVIQYEVATLPSNYDALKAASAADGGVPFEDERTELIRTELDADGNTLAGTLPELVAEYAVDLNFGFTFWQGTALETVDSSDGDFDTFFPAVETTPSDVQRVRAIRVRLSVRSREADRAVNISGLDGGLYRMGLGGDGGAPFARVRTFQADVALHNHGRSEW